MTKISSSITQGVWTDYAKQWVAASMYSKGKNFLGAALLRRQNAGYEYVVLHLICQGAEITLKGLLLFKDFEKYKPKLRKYGKAGHGWYPSPMMRSPHSNCFHFNRHSGLNSKH